MTRTLRRAAAVLATGLFLLVAAGPAAQADQPGGTLNVQTVPATSGAQISAQGQVAVTDEHGAARLNVRDFGALDGGLDVRDTQVSDDRRVVLDRVVGNAAAQRQGRPLVVGLRTERLVRWTFVDRGGRETPADRVSLLELRSSSGEVVRLRHQDLQRPRWMAAGRTQQTGTGLINKAMYWSVTRVVVDGADVVNRGQQVFVPDESQSWKIRLLFFRVEVVGRDLFFGGPTGDGVTIKRPDGVTIRQQFRNGRAELPSVPRGTYEVKVDGPGSSFTRPVSISKDQVLEIEVISRLDMVLIGTVVGLFALSLVLVGRRHHVLNFQRRAVRAVAGVTWSTAVFVFTMLVCVVLLLVVSLPQARADTPGAPGTPVGVTGTQRPMTFAYYYIWYQPTSWLRAKTDYPLIGRYSSDDETVLSRHVKMAKSAGLSGFLVSWKGSPELDDRLAKLVRVSAQEDFKLAIVYEGLDFERDPLPVSKVAYDLESFAERYGRDPVFDAFGKPVVVITGTEKYTTDQLREITAPVRDRLTVLASAKNTDDYHRTAGVLDGEAYYWSSADPRTTFYKEKLRKMGAAVRQDGGIWIAPAPTGFDARQIGGHRVIARRGGQTLLDSLAAARASGPDAVGVISWNEFSENSHVEPSRKLGAASLETLASDLGGKVWLPPDVGKWRTESASAGLTGSGALVGLLLAIALFNVALAFRRAGREETSSFARLRRVRHPQGPGLPGHARDDPERTTLADSHTGPSQRDR